MAPEEKPKKLFKVSIFEEDPSDEEEEKSGEPRKKVEHAGNIDSLLMKPQVAQQRKESKRLNVDNFDF